ncbi:type 1 glutamine amidotransferase domain-containing protein [Streptomyces sp. NBC_01497]|uniref:type 1 glutamine amidotransferase domain-containing protein n=1 Tax=Streptomyces sp. NBC_01497 TaxID=2903885 RepID=UPI002E3707D0|nr:type 1 glutamine amidotransferase domain-containing protein [Streptomyces sp. NBC_01497]
MAEILMVMTGADHLEMADGSKHRTGYWAEEFTVPHRAFTEAGHRVSIATPGGIEPSVDPASLRPEVNGGPEGAAAAAAALNGVAGLSHPLLLADVDPDDYDAVFYVGGHGPMQDLSRDADSARLLRTVLDGGTPLAVVCHGVAALLATRQADGTWPFAGYRLTGFSSAEEKLTGLADGLPWLLEDRLVALGAEYSAGEPWAPHVVIDRTLHTGQNPQSSASLAAALLKTLS